MKTYRMTRVGILQTSLMTAAIYFALSLLLIPFFFLGFSMAPHGSHSPFAALGTVFVVLLPFLYAILGFIFTAIACLIYNLLAKLVGGIEFSLEEV